MDATLIVNTEVVVAGFGLNAPVIPAGQLEVAKLTGELKPFDGVTVIEEVPLPPATIVAGVAFKAKFGATVVDKVKVPSCTHNPLL